MKNKTVIKAYQRPNGHAEFNDYLATLDDKALRKFLDVLNKIETKGQLVARKNRWLVNIRDTGIFEIRSNVAHNQHRGLGYYDNERQTYVILTGISKQDELAFTKKVIYAQQLKEEAVQFPKYVDYNHDAPKVKHNVHPVKPRKIKHKHTKGIEVTKVQTKNPDLFNVEKHLQTLIDYPNIEALAKSIEVNPIDINHFIYSPQIENVKKACDIMHISVDDLFQYDRRHTSYPNNPAWHVVKKYQQNQDDLILMKLSQNKIEISKIDKQIPIPTIFKLADKYDLTLDDLFDYQPKFKTVDDMQPRKSDAQPPSAPALQSVEASFDTEASPTTESVKTIKNEYSNQKFNPSNNKYYKTNLTSQLIRKIILKHYDKLIDFSHDEHLDMTMNDIYNIEFNRTYGKLVPMAKALQISLQTLLSYQVPHSVYDFNQQAPIRKQTLMDYFYHHVQNPILEYLDRHGYSSKIAKSQFLNGYNLTLEGIERAYHEQGIINLLTFAQNFHIKIDDLVNRVVIEQTGMNNIIDQTYLFNSGQTSANSATNLLVTKHSNSTLENSVKESDTMTENTSTSSTDNQRLNRLFDEIKQLTPNQILILNDLIQSWK